MIIFDGAARTELDETHVLHEKFRDRLGADVAEPCCDVCGRTTCYIVEPIERVGSGIRPKRNGGGGILFHMPAAFILDEDNIYIPVKVCLRCGAHGEAATGAENPDVRGLDVDERSFYVKEFRKAQAKFAEKKLAVAAAKNKYRIT